MTEPTTCHPSSPATDAFKLGLGTGGLTGATCRDTVTKALEIGYRHIDTAQEYGNERSVRRAITDAEIPSEDVFVATKLHSQNLGYQDVLQCAKQSRTRLGVDSLDLLYVHWPAHSYDPGETMSAFATLYERGEIDRIGVSNFTRELLEEARTAIDCPIFANQIEMHPLMQQDALYEYARNQGIWTVAHSPFAGGAVFDVPELGTIADKHDTTVAAVTLAWLLDREWVAAIPRATGPHLGENYEARSIQLDAEDLATIEDIGREQRVVDYEFAPWN